MFAPTIAIGPPDDPAPAAAAVDRVREYAWVVFTSRNGVDAFFDLLERERPRRARVRRCEGRRDRTKNGRRARRARHRVDFVPARARQRSGCRRLARANGCRRPDAGFPRARSARRVAGRAAAAGRRVDVVAAYSTRLVDDPGLREKAAARRHRHLHECEHRARLRAQRRPTRRARCARQDVAAIGPITAAAARDCGIRVDVVADEFTIDGLLRALERRASSA